VIEGGSEGRTTSAQPARPDIFISMHHRTLPLPVPRSPPWSDMESSAGSRLGT
jgi:hypothetical protein